MKFFMPDKISFFNKLITSNKKMECNKSCFKNSCRGKGLVSTIYLVLALHDHYLIKCLSKRNCKLSTATEENKLNVPSAFFMNKSKSVAT